MSAEDKKRPIWEEYEDYEELEYLPRGGGGRKNRSETSRTSEAARTESRESARKAREEEARDAILSVLKELPYTDNDDKNAVVLNRYTSWLMKAIDGEVLSDTDIMPEFMRAKTKAGGQNVNKVNSAVRLTHTPTMIAVRSDTTRDQSQNRTIAHDQLEMRLQQHIAFWRVLEPESHITSQHARIFYTAAHTQQ